MGINDPFSKVDPAWEPVWEFMKDPELRRLTVLLDESFFGLKNQKEKAAARLSFKEGMERVMKNIHAVQPDQLRLIIHFVRKNMNTLDAGGVSDGRSEQWNVLAEANEYLIKHHKKLWDEMTTRIYG